MTHNTTTTTTGNVLPPGAKLCAGLRRRNPARTAGTVWAGLGSRAGA